MAKSSKKKSRKQQVSSQDSTKEGNESIQGKSDSWVSKQMALIIITIISLAMAIYTGSQTVPALGWLEGLLWAVGYCGSIWVVFMGALFLNNKFHPHSRPATIDPPGRPVGAWCVPIAVHPAATGRQTRPTG